MKIYESAVRKPISTVLIFVGLMVFGLFSLSNLAVDQYPEIEIPQISVITTYPGANAADIETNITRVLEDNLNTVSNLKKLTSKSQDNVSLITVEFEYGSDLDEGANEIRDVVSRSLSMLPDDVEYPTIFKFSTSMIPVMMLAITADESYPALNKILDDKLVNVLNRVDGVGAVTIMGAPEREVQVNVDPKKLEAYNLTVEQLGNIIAAENVNIPSGTIDIGNNTFNIKADGEFTSSEDDLRRVVISNAGGRTVMLSDVAQIRDTLEKATMDERVNGQLGVRVMIQKQSGSNTVNIVKEIGRRLPQIAKTLPKDVKMELIFEGSQEITDSIRSLSETIMFAFIFVVLVVMAFLGRWRATFIICMTIPVSLICSFIYLFATGSTLNIISLSSLSIAIGMVVDDAIVVLENITTHIERGSSPKEAAIYATNEVWLSVIATTLVVVAVFLPLTMVPGMAGILFRELGWIVSIVVCVSTLAAISLTPMMSAYILKLEGGEHDYKGLGIVYKPIDKALMWLDNAYGRALDWVVHHRRITIFSMMGLFVVSLLLLTRVPTEFFPPSDNGRISATVELEQNVSVEYTARVARQIDSIIYEKFPEIVLVSASSGANSSDNAFAAMQTTGSHIINYNLRLPRSTERERSIYRISDLLREELDRIPEVRQYTVTPGGQTGSMSGTSTVDIKVFGYDMEETNTVANDLKAKMAAIPGTRDVQLSRDDLRPEFNVVFDRDRLSYYGMNSSTASQFVRNRIDGLVASKYREDGDEYDIVVRYGEPFRTSIEDVENITLYNGAGRPVKLREVGFVQEEYAAPTIERENRQRVITVKSSLGAGVALGEVVAQAQQLIDEYPTPEGVDLEVGGTVEDQGDAFSDLLMLFGLIVILVYIVMATQFESLKFPFIIMFTIPFAFTGVFVALWMTSTPLSLIALIGAIMLVGIVTKNGIVMVDYMNLLIERGAGVFDAVIAGGKSRLRPVLMTSFTTILGMVPLAIGTGAGSETWQPMGIAVIGGLTCSTILTLFIVPALYSVMVNRSQRKERQRIAKLQASHQADNFNK
ncbi:MAG: efflux RND transporter permease subunit [Alistipes sp.]|jgi:cation/multidrug efflux pump|uniref:efflux RND transporter permease subunit n=1 Tax=Alistipes sp. TaxID=1872444 RepID=UPI0011C755BD|nr:efflux RND transporter permease subunit [Alistipes sp.]MBS6099968.1 efflux RND transporter permease subunit [Alistipes sp.]HJI19172.1 efflux RND transporter permease subunit [Rikenellaceae bacterium]